MARLHLLLSRALASHHLLPSTTASSLRPTPRRPLPPHTPPPFSPPHGRTLPPFAAAASSFRIRRSSASPMLLKRRKARRPMRKGPGELIVRIGIEEDLPDDPEILSIAETLQTDVGKAAKVAFDNLEGSEYKTRDPSISNLNKYNSVEVSLLLCDDNFIRELNKEWRDEDHPTDVLSMSQHIPGLDIPIVWASYRLQLGDIVISVETAQWQAEERGHSLLDEIRILMVEANNNIEKVSLQEEHWPKLRHIICDIDGCLQEESIESLREAIATGVNIIMVTGKSRASTIRTFKFLDFLDKGDFVSETSPGVFLQGSLVYGKHGQEVYRAELDVDICKEAFLYSLKHKIPVVAYCEEQCLTLFEHPFVNLLHTVHHENKVKVMHSIEDLLKYSSIQKLILFDSAEEDSSVLRQHFSELTEGKAHVLKMQPNTIDIVPLNASKGGGIRILLDHLGITEDCDLDAVGDYTKWLSNM
ncbi:uncharacterized protein C2845_PM12G07270 [Panicum miliaceum]|uniref:Sucrose phosphatase-like domain-containing protein n=1 Tax=Panicum miliaceum TaxID=4540 RepID=A0A3L6QB48_PANMI|nr:uncharacterized protein C2845_PM12G07270 [Panicum miliaceum]